MPISRWWKRARGEYYWLEVTDRDDIGTDLNAPETNEQGSSFWGYDLMREADDGDVVFHYFKPDKAIVAYSIVDGPPRRARVVWASHSVAARNRNVRPYRRRGYRRPLGSLRRLRKPVRLSDISRKRDEVLGLRELLERQYGTPLYYPFVPYRHVLRPSQGGYIVKMPVRLVRLLELPEIARRG